MSQIENIHSTATNAEVADVGGSISKAVQNSAINDAYLQQEAIVMENNSVEMVEGMGTDRQKAKKKEIDGLDGKRDSYISALNLNLRSHVVWLESPGNARAQALLRTIRSHGNNITQASAEKESALLDSILIEFSKPEAIEALTFLNLMELVNQLRTTQEQYKEASQASDLLESEKGEIVVPTSIRKANLAQINKVIKYLNTMVDVQKEVYKPLAAIVSEKVDALNTKIRIRHASQKKENNTVES